MTKQRSLILVTLVAAVAALTGAFIARHMTAPPIALQGGTLLPQPRPVAAFSLTDHEGAPFGSAQLRGKPSLLFFGYTHCPDVCPSTLAMLAGLDPSPPIPGLRTLFVTVDPERDDALTLKRYVNAFSPRMIGLRGDDAQLDALMKSLDAVRARSEQPGGSYSVDHSATLYLIDAQGRLAAVFTPPFSLPVLRADLQSLSATLQP